MSSLSKERSILSSCFPDEDLCSDQLSPFDANHDNNSDNNSAIISRQSEAKESETKSDTKSEPKSEPNWSDDTIESLSPRRSQYRVAFEIISAKTVNRSSNVSQRNKFVSYSILIKRVPGLETRPGIIERRYSDFLALYQSLRKKFPRLLTDFPFPRKTLVGNFTPEIITQRSVAFQHLLGYCLSIRELRTTSDFYDFLLSRELKDAQRLLKSAHFEDVSNILENIYFILEKLVLHSGEPSVQLFNTLCVLTACLNAVDNTEEAQKFAKKAIELISGCNYYDSSELVVPLITLSMRLRWVCEDDKQTLERKLNDLKQKGFYINIEKQPTLLQLILTKDFLIFSNI